MRNVMKCEILNVEIIIASWNQPYRQPGKIQMDEKQVGCTDDIASGDRIQVRL